MLGRFWSWDDFVKYGGDIDGSEFAVGRFDQVPSGIHNNTLQVLQRTAFIPAPLKASSDLEYILHMQVQPECCHIYKYIYNIIIWYLASDIT